MMDSTHRPPPDDRGLIRQARARLGTTAWPGAGVAPRWTLEGYDPVAEIHRGGQGVVYQAVQRSTGRLVAVKLLRFGAVSTAADLARLQREIHILGQLRHPNIVTIHDSGEADGLPYIVMDLIDGLPLDRYVSEGQLDRTRTLELFVTVAHAVNAAHQRGIIHRDLKPANILVDGDGRPIVLDFGLAKVSTDDSAGATLTASGQFLGSLPWAAPEQASGRLTEIDIRTDVYALGVILFQLLCGELPIDTHGSVGEVLERIASAAPRTLSNGRFVINDELETIAGKALEKEPDRRFQTAGELAADVTRFLRGEPIAAKPPSIGYLLKKRYQRNRLGVLATGGVLAALCLGTIGTTLGLIWALDERAAAQVAQGEATARAAELEDLAAWQSAQLAGIDPARLGLQLRAALRAQLIDHVDADADGDHADRIDTLLAGTDFTTLALDMLRTGIFDSSLEAADLQFADQPLVQARLLVTLGDTLRIVGLLDQAVEPLNRAIAIRTTELGAEHPDTDGARMALAVLLEQRAQYEEARALFEEVLQRRESTLGPDHPDTLTARNHVAGILDSLGEHEAARELFEAVLDDRRRVLGPRHPDTLITMNDLSGTLSLLGAYDDALALGEEALPAMREVLGPDHLETLVAVDNMAVPLLLMGRHQEALTYFEEGVAAHRRLLGNDHPETLISISNLGVVLRRMGRLDEALALYAEVLEARQRTIGPDHPSTLLSHMNLAALLITMEDYDTALVHARLGLDGNRRVLGADHPRTLSALHNMGRLYKARGDHELAISTYEEALAALRTARGDDHPDTLTTIHNLAATYVAMGRHAEAVPIYREAIAGKLDKLGPQHGYTLDSQRDLALALLELGRANDALDVIVPALEPARTAWSESKPTEFGRFLVAVGRCHAGTGDVEAAEAALLEAHELLAGTTATQHYAECLRALVDLHTRWAAVDRDGGHDEQALNWKNRLETVERE